MPRKVVYGKRSRAIYDPFQAFVSPQRPAPKGNNIRDQSVFVAEVIEELSRLQVEEKKTGNGRKSGRKALGERSVNETVDPVKKTLDGGKTKRRRRKVVEEDTEDVENETTIQARDTAEWSHAQSPKSSPKRTPAAPEKPNEDFLADNVPMFMDGHGYDTEDEGTKSHNQNNQALRPHFRSQQTFIDPETPSISILPPTPPAEEEADIYTSHSAPLLNLSSHGITNFTEWSNQLTNHFSLTKIAEASFGEVYRLSLLEDLSSFSHADESVLKVIALKPPEINGLSKGTKKERAAMLKKVEAMSKVDDVANEVRLLQRMSSIPGFTNFRDVRILRGRPPAPFIKAFKDFNAEQKSRKKDPSVFPDPAKKTSYADDQLWAVIEMQDAGVDLERLVEQGECQSIWSVWDVFWQVVLALAKGEEGAEFEHRDLHLGNICVRGPPIESEGGGEIDTKRKLGFTELETTIIDYTISRALLGGGEGNNIAYHDLSHPSSAAIFEGDSTEEYQYDIYRYMRGCVVAGDPYYTPSTPTTHLSTNEPPPAGDWSSYHPRTNLIWLHYLLHSLLESLAWPSASKAPAKKKNAGKDHALWKRANDLEHVLLRVQELLDPGVVCGAEGLASAGSLVGLALEEGWMDVGDVVGSDGVIDLGDEELVEAVDGLSVSVDAKAVGEGDTLIATVEEKPTAQDGAGNEMGRGGRTRQKNR